MSENNQESKETKVPSSDRQDGKKDHQAEAAEIDAAGHDCDKESTEIDFSTFESDASARSLSNGGDSSLKSPPIQDSSVSTDRDPVAWAAWGIFVGVGGVLVFCFAWSLLPAMEAQARAACRPLSPVMHDPPTPAPDLELQDLQGNKLKLSDFRGRMVVLNFWATWCEPCITEWPDLDKLGQRLAGRDDVVVIAVSVDESLDVVPQFLQQMSLESTEVKVLWDPSKNSYKTFGSTKLPDTYFVDADGNVTSAFVNVRRWGRPEAYRCVDASASQS